MRKFACQLPSIWYISSISIIGDFVIRTETTKTEGVAKLFRHGRSQAVRLPKEFRLPGKEVRVRKVGNAVILEPIEAPFDLDAWNARMDSYRDVPFMEEGREQPPWPPGDDDELSWD